MYIKAHVSNHRAEEYKYMYINNEKGNYKNLQITLLTFLKSACICEKGGDDFKKQHGALWYIRSSFKE